VYEIYALVDPRDMLVRYVGMSVNAQIRFKSHCNMTEHNEAKNMWIRDLQELSLIPSLEILETGLSREEVRRVEHHYIQYYLTIGMPLTNVGGIQRQIHWGISGKKRREKKPLSNIPWSLGRFFTPEQAAKMIQCTEDTVRRLIRTQRIQATQIGNQWRIGENALQRHIEERSNMSNKKDKETK
jgi:excisionase family DNA binding protein